MKIAKQYSDKDVTFAIAKAAEFSQQISALGFDINSDTPMVAAWTANGDKFKMEDKFT